MNIEYFPAHKTLLIHGDQPMVIAHLRGLIVELAAKRIDFIALHELPGFRSIDGCQLFANRHSLDAGTNPDPKQPVFRCRLRPETWDNIEGLLEPFADCHDICLGHQYLDNHGEVQLIVSGRRGW